MEISTQVISAGFLVSLKGALDDSAVGTLQKELHMVLEKTKRFLLLDFSNVPEVTSSGLRSLLPYVQQVQEQKKELILFNLNEKITDLIQNSGFDSLVVVVNSLDAAMKYTSESFLKKK